MTFAGAYLTFYLANAVLETSGVIAVVVYGLVGASTMQVGSFLLMHHFLVQAAARECCVKKLQCDTLT